MERNCISWPNLSPNWLRSQWWGYVVFPQLAPFTLHDIDFEGIEKRATPSIIKCKSWDWHETNWKAKTRSCRKLPISETNNKQPTTNLLRWLSLPSSESSRAIQYMKRIRISWFHFLLYYPFSTVTIHGFAPLLKLMFTCKIIRPQLFGFINKNNKLCVN